MSLSSSNFQWAAMLLKGLAKVSRSDARKKREKTRIAEVATAIRNEA
jgi:hypothetical protein